MGTKEVLKNSFKYNNKEKQVLPYNFQIIYTKGNDQTGSAVKLGNYSVLIVNFRSLEFKKQLRAVSNQDKEE